MKRFAAILLVLFGAIAVVIAPADVRADSVPAIAGAAWLPTDVGCFSTPSFSNRITNVCPTARSWLIPMTLRWNGTTVFRATSAIDDGTHTAPTCRVVLRANADTSFFLGNALTVGGGDVHLGSVNVSMNLQTGHIDCLMAPNGRGLSAIRWNQN